MSHYMEILVEFVLAMMDKMKVINENSYNDFQLKVGKWQVTYSYLWLWKVIYDIMTQNQRLVCKFIK